MYFGCWKSFEGTLGTSTKVYGNQKYYKAPEFGTVVQKCVVCKDGICWLSTGCQRETKFQNVSGVVNDKTNIYLCCNYQSEEGGTSAILKGNPTLNAFCLCLVFPFSFIPPSVFSSAPDTNYRKFCPLSESPFR